MDNLNNQQTDISGEGEIQITKIEDLPKEVREKVLQELKPVRFVKVPYLTEERIGEFIAEREAKRINNSL